MSPKKLVLLALVFTACASVPPAPQAPAVLWRSETPGFGCTAWGTWTIPEGLGVYILQGGELTPVTEIVEGTNYYVGVKR